MLCNFTHPHSINPFSSSPPQAAFFSSGSSSSTFLFYASFSSFYFLFILWHINPLLGNNREISKYTSTTMLAQQLETATEGVFCAVRAEML
jgi:hypothetical protein